MQPAWIEIAAAHAYRYVRGRKSISATLRASERTTECEYVTAIVTQWSAGPIGDVVYDCPRTTTGSANNSRVTAGTAAALDDDVRRSDIHGVCRNRGNPRGRGPALDNGNSRGGQIEERRIDAPGKSAGIYGDRICADTDRPACQQFGGTISAIDQQCSRRGNTEINSIHQGTGAGYRLKNHVADESHPSNFELGPRGSGRKSIEAVIFTCYSAVSNIGDTRGAEK